MKQFFNLFDEMRRFNQTIAIAIMAMLFCTTRAWADVKQSDSTKVVKYCVGSSEYSYKGFDIQFYYNNGWRNTTYHNGGYGTYIKVGDADKVMINGSSPFVFGKTYTISGIEVTIVASIPDANSSTVNIQYIVTNTTSSDITIKLGSCADTQVGSNDKATVSLETNTSGQKYIVMKDDDSSSSTYGAEYKISAGLGDFAFTHMWFGAYSGYESHVFDNSTITYDGRDSALAWSWDIIIPAGATVYRFAGGGEHVVSPQSGMVSMDNYTYGGTPSTPTISNTFDNPAIIYYYNTTNSNVDGMVWTSAITGTTLNVGTYYMYAKLNSTANYSAYTTLPVAFEVEKAPLTVTANDHSITYGDAPAANDVTYSGFVDNQTSSVLGGTLGYDYNYARYGNVGDNYTITPKGLTATNYQITYASGKLTVNPRALTVTPDAEQSKTYGETDPALTYSAPELVNGDVLSGAMSRAEGENVGTYAINKGTLANSNYSMTFTSGIEFTIKAKTVTEPTITLGTTSYNYDGTEKKPDVTSVKDGDTTIPTSEYTVSYENNINVGTATVKITDKDGGNYTVSGSTTFGIAAADGSLTPPTAKTDLVYTGSPMDLITAGSSTTGTVKYSLDGSTYDTTIPQGEEAKEYTVYYKVVADPGYNDVAAQSFKVTIAPKTVTEPTITLSESSYIFDDTAKEPSVTVKDGDTTIPVSEYTVSYEDNVKVGTATVKITDVEGGNYIVNGSTTFSITQDMQTVEVETEEDKTVKTDIAATITDEENKEVTITDADIPASEVGSTEAAIPPTVEIGGETYTVTEIADNAFAGKSEITDIYLPDTEEPITIGVDALKISDTEIARVHTPLALLDDYALDKELEQHVEADKLMATVTPPNQYWTFSCGIDVKVPEGVKVYKCILNEEGTAVVIIEISEADLGGIIKANNGVLLSSTAGNPYDIIASKNDDITTIADRDEKSYGRDNLLEPVIESANYAADEYYVLYNNEFRAIISNSSKVPACKAVLHKPAGVSASRSLDIDEDETTGIRHFYAFPDGDGDWYDIKGQRVDRPAQRGVYIQKGKKIIIK